MSIKPGEHLGPYEIVGPIGRGGMGVVYRAHDARLGRDVAIKVLPDARVDDPDRLLRFEREARSASAMNHPNVVTVHDVGTHEGSPYLVTELLAGETLRERMSRGRLPTATVLEVASAIGEGLAAAHAHGIVHRDLKPENVFLTADGPVKIVDFGLAKLLSPVQEGEPGSRSTEAITESLALLGTPGYMSPEQVGGGELDFRADQFALGCILYEMLTGTGPFARESLGSTLAAVSTEDPPPLDELRPDLPPPVTWVVERCLAKGPEGRYGDTRDLVLDLATLRDRVDGLRAWAGGPTSRDRRSPWPWVAVLAVLVTAGLLAAWIALRGGAGSRSVPELRLLTYSGRDGSPAPSPDGRRIAFSSARDGQRRIWIKELGSGAEVPLTAGPGDDLPRYSRTGSEILFVRQTGPRSDLYRVPAVGGEPRRVVDDASGGDWMPDGRSVVFVRWAVEAGTTRTLLGTVGADGSAAEVVLPFEGALMHHPRVSPDGRRVALSDVGRQSGLPVAVWVVDLEDRTVSRMPGPREIGPLSAPAWLGPGRALAYSRADSVAAQLVGSPSRVLVHEIGSDEPRVVLSTPMSIITVSVAGPGTLVLDGRSARQNLLERAIGDEEAAGRWLTRGSSGDRQPVYSPDGELVAFSSRRGGSLDLWTISTATGAVRRLTDDPAEDWDPGFTRDGRLLWSSNRSGVFEIWTAAADGTSPRQVTHGTGDAQNPTATPDGEWIVFASGNPGSPGIFKIRPDGRELTRLVGGTVILPEVSPDGEHVSYVTNWGTRAASLRVVRLADGAAEPFQVELPYDPNPRGVIVGRNRWMPDGSAIAFVSRSEDGAYGVYRQAFRPGVPADSPPQELAGFHPDLITESFAISPDGGRTTLAQWDPVSSVLWAENVAGIEPAVR